MSPEKRPRLALLACAAAGMSFWAAGCGRAPSATGISWPPPAPPAPPPARERPATDPSDADDPIAALGLRLELDPSMPPEDAALVRYDLDALGKLEIDGSRVPWFRDAFGGADARAVLSFLRSRVHYVLPRYTNIERRKVISGPPHPKPIAGLPSDPGILAINFGVDLWFHQVAVAPEILRFKIGDALVPVPGTRVGVIGLGPAYHAEAAGPFTRLASWVHEARHSDCTGGLEEPSDAERLREGLRPARDDCGHLHVDCPAGHALEGLSACDAHPWGAYAIGYLFARAVSESCLNCDLRTRREAHELERDSASRVLDLEAQLAGSYGPPDMGSSGD